MKIVKGYTVAGQLLVQGHTDLVAKVGDIVRLYLDQVSDPELPEFIRATVETPIIPLQNGTQTSYGFSYDETLLDGAITRLRAKDIVDVLVYSTQGRSAYESYLITTDDDPVLTEAEWSENSNLSDLNDVAISSPASGQSLFRNGSNLWVNRAIESGDILPALQGAEADPNRIGEEYMPIAALLEDDNGNVAVDGALFANTANVTLASGVIGWNATLNCLVRHDGLTIGGNPITFNDPLLSRGNTSITNFSTTKEIEIASFPLTALQAIVGKNYKITGWMTLDITGSQKPPSINIGLTTRSNINDNLGGIEFPDRADNALITGRQFSTTSVDGIRLNLLFEVTLLDNSGTFVLMIHDQVWKSLITNGSSVTVSAGTEGTEGFDVGLIGADNEEIVFVVQCLQAVGAESQLRISWDLKLEATN